MATAVLNTRSVENAPQYPQVDFRETQAEVRDGRFFLDGVSWDFYDLLLKELNNRPIRVTYDRGKLEIMSPSRRHEKINRWLAALVDITAVQLKIPFESNGSATWRRKDIKRGLEADSCYYFTNAPLINKRDDLDLSVDPPPDVAIEIDISNSSIDKISIYSALGVPELWIYERDELQVFGLLPDGNYELKVCTAYLPPLVWTTIKQFMVDPADPDLGTWLGRFGDWARENLKPVITKNL